MLKKTPAQDCCQPCAGILIFMHNISANVTFQTHTFH
jgi:hypothetical protein